MSFSQYISNLVTSGTEIVFHKIAFFIPSFFAMTLTENWTIFIISLVIGLVGFLIKLGLDELKENLIEIKKEQNSSRKERAELATTINKTFGSLEHTEKRIETWHQDRQVIFDRLRKVEIELSIIERKNNG